MANMPMPGYPKGPHEDRYNTPWDPKQIKYGTASHTTNPTEYTISTLFPQFNRWAIGFDPLLATFKQVAANTKSAGYPPYNIYRDEDTYVLELAVAGFSKYDISISVKELQLTVEGKAGDNKLTPIHKGIATRDFKQNFVLAEYVVVKGAELKDGLLQITLEQELPEEKKAKVISIL